MTGAGARAREQCGLVVGRGPRAVESAWMAEVARLAAEARADPRRLASPVRLVVPSRSLRLHVAARIARELGPTAGLVVQTLHGVAAEILERSGQPAESSDEWVELLVRRHARAEPALAEALGTFEDGFRAVAATVRDLVDAGLEAGSVEAVRECLAATRAGAPERRVHAALVAVAECVAQEVERHGTGGRSELLRRARAVVEAEPDVLPTRALLVHGFADATARAAELLEALATRFPGAFFLDVPDELGAAFTARLRGRIEGRLGAARACPPAPEAPPLFFRAPGPESEAHEVAHRVRVALESGVEPESITIVARDLTSHRAPLRAALARLGVPFSGLRARAPLDGAGRRLVALVELLESSGELATERWLDALAALRVARGADVVRRSVRAELRVALRMLGATRVADVAALRPQLEDDGRFPLPIRTGIVAGGSDESRRAVRGLLLARKKLEAEELHAVRRAARAVLARFRRWPAAAPLAEHLEHLARLRRTALGWRARDLAESRARAALERLAAPAALAGATLARDEFAALVRRALLAVAEPELGGAGGGVQVLDAMEARARTAAHLFVIGLNRDVFPRVVREDPLLGDAQRRALESCLPDVPVKARGRAEDRYLFAQLLASAEHVTLSWPQCDDDGKRRVLSPLVERLLAGGTENDVPIAPALHQVSLHQGPADGARPRTALESAIRSGLAGERASRAELFELCLAEISASDPATAPAIAGARARVLSAYERGPHEPRVLSPWLGFVGAVDEIGVRPDLAREPPFVTHVEALAKCPWQALLAKVLKLDQGFEALDGAARIDPRSVGNLVHEVLEELAREVLGPDASDLATALRREPVAVPWPAPARLEELLVATARRVLEPARASAARVRWLIERARPHFETARVLLADEAERGGGVVGVELEGRARIESAEHGPFEVLFRADRAERLGEGLVLTDFKTGQPLASAKLRKEGIPRGTNLQPIAYVLAARAVDPEARGRYLFLGRELGADDPSVGLGANPAAETDFLAVLAAVFGAWRAGTFFPRLYDEKKDREPDACRLCAVAQACLRGDSGARMAVAGWLDSPLVASGADTALRELWGLAQKSREEPR